MTVPQKDKRRFLRFSVRALTIVVTLMCVYLGTWRATVVRGIADVTDRVHRDLAAELRPLADGTPPLTLVSRACELDAGSPLPFVVSVAQFQSLPSIGDTRFLVSSEDRRFYLWFWGVTVPLGCALRQVK
jgi:hypothetical protein